MAEAAAIALVEVIFEKLADEAFKKYIRSQGIHDELQNWGRELSQIEALLNDASDKEVKDEAVKKWLNDLQHLAYDIDDVLDDVATEAMRHELNQESEASTSSKVRKLVVPITCCTNLSLSNRLSPKFDRITGELDRLYKARSGLGLTVKVEKQKDPNRGNENSLPESDVVGREGMKKKLLNKLLGGGDESSKENFSFSIIPIVGMGGVGKTTLARLLYNDAQVKDHFKLKAWVCVSEEFNIFKISKTIFQSVSTENKQFEDVNQLQVALGEQFKDKRFLLVLDDVWNESYDDWEKLVRPFQSGAPGSTVIITTRKEQLLKKLGFNHLDHVKSLSYEDALSLFALHALGVDNFDLHATVKPQGEGIVKKCSGLPLALKAIGRLLRTKTDGEEWDVVLNSEIWDLENSNEIVPALRLSYHDLSADLKRLFAYCSLFPKDYLFDKEELVLLWMAEGYLSESSANKSPELLGQEYFEKLLSRSFFQHAPNDESLFVMHDLMNDMATFAAGEYFLRFDNQMETGGETLAKYRHMSFVREKYVAYQKFATFQEAKSLRTLLAVFVGVEESWQAFYLSDKILVDLIPQLPLLRVLSLTHFLISEAPELIGNLKHLRYLNLSRTRIEKLPENVGNLYNLQTLIVCGCRRLTTLPKSFQKLKKLRHFDISNTPLLKMLPLGIGELRSLHTLTKIIIGGDNGFVMTKLKGFEKLHGEISIEGLQTVQNPMDAQEALSQKRLTKLELKWDDGFQRGMLEKDVLNELKPASDRLKELAIDSYKGIEFPNWVGNGSFNKLVRVQIRGCRKCTSLPPFGQLPSLKELFIQGMDEVKVIGIANVFSSLEILEFKDMSGWEEWSADSKVSFELMFPRLRELRIKECPKLFRVSLGALPSLKVLKIVRCRDCVLRSLVRAATLIRELNITSISSLVDEEWRDITRYLGSVDHLSICNCDEIRYLWESEAKASKFLVNLTTLSVSGCDKLVSLGEKEEEDVNFGSSLLSSLRWLDVYRCRNMESCCCPNNIESLNISCCSSVAVYFPTATTGGGGQNFKSLRIWNCEKVMENINNISMPMQLSNSIHLTHLYIHRCPSIESFPDIQLPNLTSLGITWCTNLKSFPEIQLPSLTILSITECENLNSFPDLQLMSLTLLNHLKISNCPSIDASFPCGYWPSKLVSLQIGGLKKPFSDWGPQNFPPSLVSLTLHNEPHVTNFSPHILLPSSLTRLHIKNFYKLKSLSVGLQHLTSLQHLSILNCPKMKHLPKTLLPSLLSLYIDECPNLRKRYEGRGSRYWPLICHIPDLSFN